MWAIHSVVSITSGPHSSFSSGFPQILRAYERGKAYPPHSKPNTEAFCSPFHLPDEPVGGVEASDE